jgi:hypothetical protein
MARLGGRENCTIRGGPEGRLITQIGILAVTMISMGPHRAESCSTLHATTANA